MSFEQSLDYYRQHQEDLAKENYGKFVLIIDGSIINFYDDEPEAYLYAKKQYPSKHFLLRKCIRVEEEETAEFHSRVF